MSTSNGGGSRSYNPETETYQLYHDWGSSDRISIRIVSAVAAITDTPPTEMSPLYTRVDPDALDRLFRPIPTEDRRGLASTLSFTLNGCEVTIYGDGRIEIQLPNEG